MRERIRPHLHVHGERGALVAFVVGVFAVRTSGAFFIMVTLAAAEMFYAWGFRSKMFNGADGMSGVPRLDLTAIGIDLSDPATFALTAIVVCIGVWLALEVDGYELWDAWIIIAIVLWFVGSGAGGRLHAGARDGTSVQAIDGAKALAMTALDYLCDAGLRERSQAFFSAVTG